MSIYIYIYIYIYIFTNITLKYRKLIFIIINLVKFKFSFIDDFKVYKIFYNYLTNLITIIILIKNSLEIY